MVVALRLVDNKAILYFDAPSPSDALNWYRGPSMSLPFFLGLTNVLGFQQSTYIFLPQKPNKAQTFLFKLSKRSSVIFIEFVI